MSLTLNAWDLRALPISKRREESWKYDAQRSIFDGIWGVKIADETLSEVFDISSQTKQKLRSKQRSKIVTESMLIVSLPVPSHRTLPVIRREQKYFMVWIVFPHFYFYKMSDEVTINERRTRDKKQNTGNGLWEGLWYIFLLKLNNISSSWRRGYTWRRFWRRLTRPFCQYLGHVLSTAKSLSLLPVTTVWRFCVNFWVIFGHFGKENFF